MLNSPYVLLLFYIVFVGCSSSLLMVMVEAGKLLSRSNSSRPLGIGLTPKPRPYYPIRPFFNIAHMVNTVQEIQQFLDRGANAIETDIYFAPNATPVFTFHGYPCDCFRRCGERERLQVFLEQLRAMTTPNDKLFDPRLLLVLMDLKMVRISHSAKALAGQQLAQTLLNSLYNQTSPGGSPDGSRVRTLISINHVFDYDFVLGFQNEMESQNRDWLSNQYIGWDVGMNDPLFAIESMWKRLDMVQNIWQGDGRANCMAPFYNLGRLTQIIKRRDNPSYFAVKNYIRKVYHWTVDLTVNIRTALRSNVDAIMTNHPERVWSVLKEREFVPRFRMAQYEDSPWERVWTVPAKPLTSSMLQKPTLGLKLINGAGDVVDSLAKFLTETIKTQTPLRYLFLSAYQQRQRRFKQRQRLSQYKRMLDHDGNVGREWWWPDQRNDRDATLNSVVDRRRPRLPELVQIEEAFNHHFGQSTRVTNLAPISTTTTTTLITTTPTITTTIINNENDDHGKDHHHHHHSTTAETTTTTITTLTGQLISLIIRLVLGQL